MRIALAEQRPSRVQALVEAFAAISIWASSFLFVKMGLAYMGPLFISGVRYLLAFLLLLPLLLADPSWRRLGRREWGYLIAIGLTAYALGSGMLYWGLKYLTATTSAFLSALTPLPVLVVGILWLREWPTRWQVTGVVVSLAGIWFFFGLEPLELSWLGIGLTALSIVGYTAFAILGRAVAREALVNTLVLTTIPLGIGGGVLTAAGLLFEPSPTINVTSLSIIAWLTIINSAVAYFIYNHALQTLTALEMNVMFNLITPMAAIMAVIWLGESLNIWQVIGIVVTTVGVIMVQMRPAGHARPG